MGAASSGNLGLLKILFCENTSLDFPNKLSFTPLHVAVQNEQYDAAAYLLERRADPMTHTNTMSCSLHLAARQGNQRCVELLLKHRADVNVEGLEGITPLHTALSQGHADVVQVLLSHGAKLMGTLHKASSAGQVKMVAELLGRRADPGERDGEGRTALHLAVCRPDVSGKTPLHETACKGCAMVAKSLLAAKADPTD